MQKKDLAYLTIIGILMIALLITFSQFNPKNEKTNTIFIREILENEDSTVSEDDEDPEELEVPEGEREDPRPYAIIEQGQYAGVLPAQPAAPAEQQPQQQIPDNFDSCYDSDNGRRHFIKGETLGYWIADIEPFDYPPSTQDDWCTGNVLNEMICKSSPQQGQTVPRMVGTTYVCPHGCSNGACICQQNYECGSGYECSDGVCLNI